MVGCPRTSHRPCLLMTTTANAHQSAAYDLMNARTTRTQHHRKKQRYKETLNGTHIKHTVPSERKVALAETIKVSGCCVAPRNGTGAGRLVCPTRQSIPARPPRGAVARISFELPDGLDGGYWKNICRVRATTLATRLQRIADNEVL